VDANAVYWTAQNWLDDGDDAVMKVALSGGTPAVLATGQHEPGAIAVGGNAVYWINRAEQSGDGGVLGGSIMKVAK
jgi:hypothetical protein